MESNKDTVLVYVELLDEGTECWRPTYAKDVGDGLFTLLPTENYDPSDESWAFLPGDVVRLEKTIFGDNTDGLAVQHSNPNVIRISVPQKETDALRMRDAYALNIGDGKFKILATPHYNPNEHHWEFVPESVVHLKKITLGGFSYLIPENL
jgi:hypothetical protein